MFRTPYDDLGVRHRLSFEGTTSRTKQSFKDESDINNIMKRYASTGLLTHVAKHNGRYEDVSAGLDYQSSMAMVLRGKEAFASLPAALRKRFNNDPGEFLDFVGNPENEKEMRELGILKAKPVVAPVVAPVVPNVG